MGSNSVVTKKAHAKKEEQSRRVASHGIVRAADASKNNRQVVEVASPDEIDIWELLQRRKKAFQVKAEGDKLTITLARFDPPTRSISGKSFVVATTGGVKRSKFLVNGSPVHVVATAFFYDDDGQAPAKFMPLFDLPKEVKKK